MLKTLFQALLWFCLATAVAYAEVAVPPLTARVTDLTGTLTAEQKSNLKQTLQAFEAKKGSQIAVLIVPTTEPEAVEQYSIRVAEQWKLGRKGVDDGALLLIAKNDRAMRIEVGYGLEGALPDAIAKRIIAEVITPYLKSGDFYGGIQAGVQVMIKVMEGEPLPPPPPASAETTASSVEQLFPLALLLAFFVSPLLRAMVGRLPAALTSGAIAGVIVWFVIGSFLIASFLGILMTLFALFGGLATGRGGWGGGYSGGGFGGGGGSGGGGFGGGGGGFGGGGASGRW